MRINQAHIVEAIVAAFVLAMVAVIVTGCTTSDVERIKDAYNEYKDSQEQPKLGPPPVVEPTPEPQPEPEPINHGGDGLYKPESQLWLLPRYHPNGQQMQCRMLGRAGEYRDEAGTQLVKYFIVGGRNGPRSSGGPYNIPDGEGMHNYRVKLRDAKATASGNWFLAWDINNNLIYKMQIIDRNVRQE